MTTTELPLPPLREVKSAEKLRNRAHSLIPRNPSTTPNSTQVLKAQLQNTYSPLSTTNNPFPPNFKNIRASKQTLMI